MITHAIDPREKIETIICMIIRMGGGKTRDPYIIEWNYG